MKINTEKKSKFIPKKMSKFSLFMYLIVSIQKKVLNDNVIHEICKALALFLAKNYTGFGLAIRVEIL